MDQKDIMKQMIAFNKISFENIFNTVVMFHEQAEKVAETFMTQNTMLPDEGKKVVNEWVKSLKKGRDDYKASMDAGFKKLEDYFVASGK